MGAKDAVTSISQPRQDEAVAVELAAYTGGAGIVKGVVRVTFWGASAIAITAGVGMLFGGAV